MEADMQFGAALILASVFLIALCGASRAGDDPPLTQEHVLGTTMTAKAPDRTEKAEPPQAIHPLSKEDRKALKDEHRVVSGKTWNAITPEQRDETIRNLRAANAP